MISHSAEEKVILKRQMRLLLVLVMLVATTGTLMARNTPRSRKGAKATAAATATPTANSSQTTKSASREATETSISEAIRNADSKSAETGDNYALELTISGAIRERGETLALLATRAESLKDYLDALRRARDDRNVKAVVIRIAAAEPGLAMVQELRNAITEVRARGKKTYGIVEDDSQSAYLVLSACEQVIMPPSADIMITGVKADSYFLRELLEKLGLHADVVHVGQYKSYGEMFTQDDFTTPARANMTEIVDDIYAQLLGMISDSRGLPREAVEKIVNSGPVGAKEAVAAKLVDRVAYADEVYRDLKKEGLKVTDRGDYMKESGDKSEDLNLFSLLAMSSGKASPQKSTKYPEVAVVYAVGPIMPGSQEGLGLSGADEIYANDLIDVLDDMQKSDKVRAVILRVDSPGGSAFASDLIWRKVDDLRSKKPVVVSMGDVAASGGYYISMGANRIIAEPGTLTGSIGVVGGKLNLAGGLEKLGVHKVTIARGDFSQLYSETSNFSPRERELIEHMMKRTYDEFVDKATLGRKIPRDRMLEIAQGKVWMGSRAKEIGLVDDLGGLGKAIAETKKLIGLRQDERVSLVAYPKQLGMLDILQKAIGSNVTASISSQSDPLTYLPVSLKRVLQFARNVGRLFEQERVLAVMPFVLSIN